MDLTKRLAGKTAVVTAAAQGIGRAVAERLMAEGANVYASDLNGDLVSTLIGAKTAILDATDGTAVTSYFDQFDQVDILVHAVGYVHQGTIEECSPEDWRRSCSITLDSAYYVLGATVPKMKAHGGSIITIGSVASSIKGFPKRAAYGATKGGVLGLTKAVAADYIKEGIRCNSVCPGTVDSPSLHERIEELADKMGSKDEAVKFFIDRQPAGRFGTPNEIAGLCAFLASEDGAFVNGQAIKIDGGITI
ncbi:MAG: SDR family oxidoreductase [Amylibacter sp.]|jgi:2-keto-3-deoxy-L-fuconate dehydrogenase|tara:strand:- start:7304 stop:8050 length:747 start_codon:yes stop_codon:yes gene_type:complete